MTYLERGKQKLRAQKIPYVVAKCAQTIDGKSAASNGNSQWITSAKTREFARSMRDQFDAILVGTRTVQKDNPRLNGKRKNKKIKKIILDAALKISGKANLFKGMPASSCIVVVSRKVSQKKIKTFRAEGHVVIVCPLKSGLLDLKWLLKNLGRNGVRSVLIEGGATVVGYALTKGLVDELHTYIAPKVAGDQHALSSVVGRSLKTIQQTWALEFIKSKRIGKDIFIQSHVLRHR